MRYNQTLGKKLELNHMLSLQLKSQCKREVPTYKHMAFKPVKNGIPCAPNSNLIKRILFSILKYRSKLLKGYNCQNKQIKGTINLAVNQ